MPSGAVVLPLGSGWRVVAFWMTQRHRLDVLLPVQMQGYASGATCLQPLTPVHRNAAMAGTCIRSRGLENRGGARRCTPRCVPRTVSSFHSRSRYILASGCLAGPRVPLFARSVAFSNPTCACRSRRSDACPCASVARSSWKLSLFGNQASPTSCFGIDFQPNVSVRTQQRAAKAILGNRCA